MHLSVGTYLQNGRYEILRYISSGGFGCTYEARDTKFKSKYKTVAIKEFFAKDFCNRDTLSNSVVVGTLSKKELFEKLRNKFIDEAEALYDLQHSNIVRVTDKFEENGTAYYVMDYIDGKSLNALIEEKGCLGEQEALGYIRQVAAALDFVHKHNRLHLDVKPHNIMVDGNGKAILIDFGVSKQYDEVSGENTSTLMGHTPGYAPIEQTGRALVTFNAACDIYALGATLYKALTGKTPIDATLRAGGLGELDYPSHVSHTMRHAIDKAMKISRVDRPQSIAEFLALLSENEDAETAILTPVETGDETVHPVVIPVSPVGDDGEAVSSEIASDDAGTGAVAHEEEPAPEEAMAVADEAHEAVAHEEKPVKKSKKPLLLILFFLLLLGGGFYLATGNNSGDIPARKPEKQIVTDIQTVAARLQAYQDPVSAAQAAEQRLREEAARLAQQQQQQGISTDQKVDLGLSVYWAGWNVGASSPEGYGDYYAWGKTNAKSSYTEDNSSTYGKSMGSIAGNSTYDVASAEWSGSWRMPTKNEFQELIDRCTWTWTTYKGERGYKVTGPNGNSIFIPAAGWRGGTSLYGKGARGYYWSATPYEGGTGYAYGLDFGGDGRGSNWSGRYDGRSVRPVSEKKR